MRLREEEEEEVGRETREVMGRVIHRLASSLRPPPSPARPIWSPTSPKEIRRG